MNGKNNGILKERLGEKNYEKLVRLENPKLHEFVAKYVELCNPEKVFVCTDSEKDMDFIRKRAIESGEEKRLAIRGHTMHFDGYYDQARDKANTKFLLPPGVDLGKNFNSTGREEGLKEMHEILRDIMKGHEMYVMLMCLGPCDSKFTIPSVQLTDSSYVAHNLNILYRPGYEHFRSMKDSPEFFRFVHSEGELENGVSKNTGKRRIYIDLEDEIVYSVNTQYGGNTIGLKKLAMRLAINKGRKEDWLCEHMFVMGIHGPKGRVTYFTGAYPSLCGKTTTSMLPHESIVGDDIAYLRVIDNKARAVNVERGLFGVIQGVNKEDEPLIWKVLTTPGEAIFSNVLMDNKGNAYWIGDGRKHPGKGWNHSGEWQPGKKDKEGNEITPSHKNARFTVSIDRLENKDPKAHDPAGVEVGGIIYGGRDSDTWNPVQESLNWEHGMICKGASLESETTAATLGKEGVRMYNPMANLDFLSVPIGRYVQMNLGFGKKLAKPPPIFAVNYFLKNKNGGYVNDISDKFVWLKWMELRSHGEVKALRTPTGFIPKYGDLRRLFREALDKEYTMKDYVEQFKLRVKENLAKIERITRIYREMKGVPEIVFKVLEEEKKRLEEAKEKHGDYIPPEKFEEV